ncbi:MAG: dihydroorotate dehydrogenase (quinone), partial [Pseudomonadota bacterium]
FNNQGMEAIATRLRDRPKDMVLGLNLGANKDSADRAEDYAAVLSHCAPFVDFATVNVSSPNTERLRDLQGRDALRALLARVGQANTTGLPLFLKIAPDLDPAALDDICEVALAAPLSGLIATNTTLARDGLSGPHRDQAGGLSGAPLFDRSTRILAQLAQRLEGRLPLIGVGGVSSGAQAYAKIKAGASAVQLYTGLVYHGIGVMPQILAELEALLEADGFATVADAVGTDLSPWL